MKRILLALFLFGISAPAWAACPSYPYTLTNGTTADAGQVMANLNTVMGCINTPAPPPQGRLTLTSNTPVMTADATAQGTVYYDCYVGSLAPIYNGTSTSSFSISSCEISLALNATNQTSGNLYDIFAFNNSGTMMLCAGPAWTNSTTRSTPITLSLGYWTNNASLAHCYNGATDYGSISVNQATYLGTLYATANGQTGMQFKPTAALGGNNSILGLYNAYNRVRMVTHSADSTTSWTYGTPTFRSANNSNSNRVTWVDGLGQSYVEGRYICTLSVSATSGYGALAFDSTSNPNSGNNSTYAQTNTSSVLAETAFNGTSPDLGLHFFQAVEFANSPSAIYYGGVNQMQVIASLEM